MDSLTIIDLDKSPIPDIEDETQPSISLESSNTEKYSI